MYHHHHRGARRRARHWADLASACAARMEWAFAGCAPPAESPTTVHAMHAGEGAGVGRRRLLRHLAHRLDLSPEQVSQAARILERLKIERAQADVDLRRTSADLADAIEGEAFDREQARGAAGQRVEAAQRVQDAVTRALGELHGVLDAEQRRGLAMLIRTRAISF